MKPKKINLRTFKLSTGAHPSPDAGMCVMELAAYLAGRPHSDHPPCVSGVIGQFLRSWNDVLNDRDRQMLKPYAKKVLGTATNAADEETRAWLATDWLVRVHTPKWLDLAGLKDDAKALRNLQPLTSSEIAVAVQSVIDGARQRASAASPAAWDAAWAAAWAAARDAAGDAAWAAAWAAARDAAGDAAWAAAWAAARAAAWAAAWAAARDAAEKRLRPTVRQLQKSALELLDRMIAVGKTKRTRKVA
jgi:hypothetical protein